MYSSLLRIAAILLALAFVSNTTIGLAEPVSDSSDDADEGNQSTSVELTRKQAEKGNSTAQYNLGLIYHDGKGVDQDLGQAAKWFRAAAEKGLVDAQYNLGLMLALGQGVPQDFAEASKWWNRAALKGDAGAQYNLALL
jgi:TPR repeat protein